MKNTLTCTIHILNLLSLSPMKKQFFDSDFKLGILGGGQLGRMMLAPALDLGVALYFLDPNGDSPCLQIVKNQMIGDFNDKQTVLDFGKDKDLISVEIEHVNTEALHELVREGKKVYPQPSVLDIIKDKGVQKQWFLDHGIPTADFYLVADMSEVKMDYPFVQKLRTGGYDGQGVQVVKNEMDAKDVFNEPSVIENLVDFEVELAVIVARNEDGEVNSYPMVSMAFDDKANLVSYLYSPSGRSIELEDEAKRIAEKIIIELKMVGLLAIEFFLTKDGKLLVNEMAPRPHNSGHHTIEANVTSQYEQFLRAILNLPLGSTSIVKPSVMINLLGSEGSTGVVKYQGIERYLQKEGVYFHIYGKRMTKPYRKMGHVTVMHDDMQEAVAIAEEIKNNVKVICK